MQPSEEKGGLAPLRKIVNSKWAVWICVFIAVLLLCVTATVTFAFKNRGAPKPVSVYSPMTELEARYGMADLQVTSSNGLGVEAGSTPVAAPDTSVPAAAMQATGAAAGQTAAPKVGPAPAASEIAPLQPVTNGLPNVPVTLQAGVQVLGADVQATVDNNALDANVKLGL